MKAGIVDNTMASPSVLVTGCNGYVATHTIKSLRNTFDFVGIDLAPGGNETVLVDLRDYSSLDTLDNHDFSYVVHTAWDQTSNNIYKNNINSSGNLLSYLARRKIRGLIFISSSYVSTTAHIQYTRSKIEVENMIFDSGMPFVIIRPDMLYSPAEKKMQEQLAYMKKGFAICIGTGRSLRTPTHINDLTELIKRIITADMFTNKVYEIGSPISYSQEQILKIVAAHADLKPLIIKIPTFVARVLFNITKKVDPEQAQTINYDRVADLRALQADFDLQPVDFTNGITK